MKTASEVRAEIDKIIFESELLPKDSKERKKNQTRVTFLQKCLQYLEGEPREEFVLKMLSDLTKRKNLAISGFGAWVDMNGNVPIEKRRAAYLKYIGMAEINDQLKHLNYILQ